MTTKAEELRLIAFCERERLFKQYTEELYSYIIHVVQQAANEGKFRVKLSKYVKMRPSAWPLLESKLKMDGFLIPEFSFSQDDGNTVFVNIIVAWG